MIETFRFLQSGFPASYIKITEGFLCHSVHVIIHDFQVIFHHCFDKFMICLFCHIKPCPEKSRKHDLCFFVCNFEMIPRFHFLAPVFHLDCFQISTCHQQTPYRTLVHIQLVKHDLLIEIFHNFPSLQQFLHLRFHFRRCRLN